MPKRSGAESGAGGGSSHRVALVMLVRWLRVAPERARQNPVGREKSTSGPNK